MVRFSWPIREGTYATTSACEEDDGDIRHMRVDVEIAGQYPMEALFTLPRGYLEPHKLSDTGVVFAHGNSHTENQGKFMYDTCMELAKLGIISVRFNCKTSEARRVKMFTLAIDSALASPYCQGIKRWVLGGRSVGARVATAVLPTVDLPIIGCFFCSYPLHEPANGSSSPPAQASIASRKGSLPDDWLYVVEAPVLFTGGAADERCERGALEEAVRRVKSVEKRACLVQGLDHNLRVPRGNQSTTNLVTKQLVEVVVKWVVALRDGSVASCGLPPLGGGEIPVLERPDGVDATDLLNTPGKHQAADDGAENFGGSPERGDSPPPRKRVATRDMDDDDDDDDHDPMDEDGGLRGPDMLSPP